MYINKAMVFGNLTRDPELRALPNGGQVCSFGLATNRVYKKADGTKQEEVEFHNIVMFGKLAELCGQYLKKGSSAYIGPHQNPQLGEGGRGQAVQDRDYRRHGAVWAAARGPRRRAARSRVGTGRTGSKGGGDRLPRRRH